MTTRAINPDTEKPSQTKAVLLALAASFLWASSFIYIEIGLDEELPPISFAAMRYVIGAVALTAIWMGRGGHRNRTVRGAQINWVLLLGVMLYGAVPVLQFIGLDLTDPITFNFVFQAGIPLVLAVTAGVALRERTTRWEWLGVLVVAFGAWLFFPVRPTGAQGVAVILAALAAVFIGGSNLIQRRTMRVGATWALEVTTISMIVGAALLSILGLVLEDLPMLNGKLILLLLVLGVVNTAAAFVIWHHAIATLRALHIGVIASAQLIFVPLMARWILNEQFGAGQAAGSIAVLVGIALVHYSMAWSKGRAEATVAQ